MGKRFVDARMDIHFISTLSRSVVKDELEEAVHVVIRTLENTHWQCDMEARANNIVNFT